MISACIVTYQSLSEVTDALKSLEQARKELPLTVYVVDNASTDGVGQVIHTDYPFVNFIQSDENLGFGKANNLMLPLIQSDYHLLINPDITFETQSLKDMLVYMEKHPEAAILTPRVMFPDGTEQKLPKFAPTVRYLLGGFLENKGRLFQKWRGMYTGAELDLSKPTPVQIATGCFMLIRTSVFKKLNGFDERFFMYLEDTDLSLQALKEGQIIYHPDCCVTHAWKRGSHKSAKGLQMHLHSLWLFFQKWGWKF